MNIDGHTVRTDSINAVTEIEIVVSGAHEGTDKIARGQFDILIHGQKLSITREKRFRYEASGDNEALKKAAVKNVWDLLTEIRDPIVAAIP